MKVEKASVSLFSAGWRPGVFDCLGESLPVVRHRLGQFQQLRRQILRAMKVDPKLAGAERYTVRQILDPVLMRAACHWNLHTPGGKLSAGTLQVFGESGPAGDLPLKALAGGGALQARDQSLAFDSNGVANLQGREASHHLAGAPLSDTEELFDSLPVEMAGFHAAQDFQNFVKPMKPCGLSWHA